MEGPRGIMGSVSRSSLFCDMFQLSVNDRVPIDSSELWTVMTHALLTAIGI
jgi:hypothetical protein